MLMELRDGLHKNLCGD